MTDFIEYMVERKKTPLDIIKATVYVVLCFIVVAFLVMLGVFPTLTTLLVVGVIYVAYRLASAMNTEYEYILTNYEMDVDRIINKRTRKKLDTVNLRRIDEFEMCDGNKENRFLNDGSYKKIFACRDREEGCAYITYQSDEGKKILLFSPNEEITEYIKRVLKGRF